MKVLLILSDGMRPDAIDGLDFIEQLKKKSSYTLNAQTVLPSVTLPCHMSLFHSVDPDRHGITSNIYTPMVRPINGICEQLKNAKKTSSFFYTWEEIRDLARPGSLLKSEFLFGRRWGYERANHDLCEKAKEFLNSPDASDFTFLYLGWTDLAGHNDGWMSEGYMYAARETVLMMEDVIKSLPDDFAVIFTSDHGGHGRDHGSDMPEDMTIPVFCLGEPFEAGKELENINIKDIAPTILKLLDGEPDPDWEGKAII